MFILIIALGLKDLLSKVLYFGTKSINFTEREIAMIVKSALNAIRNDNKIPQARGARIQATKGDAAVHKTPRLADMFTLSVQEQPKGPGIANPRQARYAYQELAHNNSTRVQ